jgi:dihydrofolate synthase/folylpolyglutamate synthase
MVRMPHWPKPHWQELTGDSTMRIHGLLNKLGNPENKLPPVIHVAGTNGKGSTIAFLRAILKAAGYTVHAYISPHIRDFNERILLNDTPIDEGLLTQVMEEVRLTNGETPISFFEGTTAGALLAFSRAPADVLIVETGMGGKYDPTNVIPHKVLTIITPIFYDHMEYLGYSLDSIAWHKAGIMRAGVPCVVSHQLPEVLAVLEGEAKHIGAPLYIHGKHWGVRRQEDNGLRFIDINGETDFPAPSLLGDHQYINAGTALAALSTLENFDVSGEAVVEGLQKARWVGRLEHIKGGAIAPMLPEGYELWFDGGHNASGAMAIARWVEQDWADKPTYVIFGTTKGKELGGIFEPLVGKIEKLCAVSVTTEPKSYSAEEIETAALNAGLTAAAFASVEDAVKACVADSDKPARILGFGSFYLRLMV